MVDISGVIPAVVTPFTIGGGAVMLDWISQHLEYLRRRGIDGVLIMGTNGEGPSLSLEERRAVIDAWMAARSSPTGRMPVLVGTGCAAMPDTIAISRYAVEAGADALMVLPPFFFKEVTPRGLFAYYQELLRALPPDSPVLLYNIPGTSGVEISDELIDALLPTFGHQVVGVKDTSGSLERTQGYLSRYPQLAIYEGSDGLAAAAARSGAKGSISAVANLFPEMMRAAMEEGRSGVEAGQAQQRVNVVRQLLHRYGSHTSVKHILHWVGGLPLTYVRPPLEDLTSEPAAALRQELETALGPKPEDKA